METPTGRLLEVLARAELATTIQDLAQTYFSALADVVPHCGFFSMLADRGQLTPPSADSGQVSFTNLEADAPPAQHVAADGFDPRLLMIYGEKFIQYDPIPGMCMAQPGHAFWARGVLPKSEWDTNPLFADFVRQQLGFEDAISAMVEIPGGRVFAYSLYRRDGQPYFGDEAARTCEQLHPQLAELVHAALLSEAQAGSLPPAPSPSATVTLGAANEVLAVAPGGEAFWDWLSAGQLPIDLLLESPQAGTASASAEFVRLSGGGWVRAEVGRLNGEGSGRVVMLDLIPNGSREHFKAEAGRFSLTPRELEVAVLALRGESNKAIGKALGSSDLTVKQQLASVYRKTGSEGRAELASLLMSPGELPPGAEA